MSCTSPWDWSIDSQSSQELTSAAAWAKSMFPQPTISVSQWAMVSNQNQSIQNLLVARGEGYAATRKTRHDLLKKKFESFHFLENETLNDITTRYYHLMCEMHYFGVLASQQEMVARFADALPPKWSPFIELLKHAGVLDAVNQPKLQTAFVSNTSSSPFPQFNQSAYLSRSQPQPQAQPQPQPQVSTTQPQFDPSVDCGPAIQLGNGDQTRTALYVEIVKNVNDGESSGNDDRSGYSGSSDEESNLNEGTDSEADNLSNDAKETKGQKSDLIKKVDATSKEMEKILTEDGSFSSQIAFVANVTASTSQVQSKTPSICSDCADMKLKCAELKCESETVHSHNQSLVIELFKCKVANMALTRNEKDFQSVIETLKKSVSELNKVVYHKQVSINDYINLVEETKRELAIARCEHDAIKQKLESYSNSRFVLDHIIDVQQPKGNQKGIGYKKCSPPLMNNYTKMPDEEEMPRYEPSVPLDFEEFATGLGFKPNNSSNTSSKQQETSASMKQSPPIIEDYETSDNESELDVSDQNKSLTSIYILMLCSFERARQTREIDTQRHRERDTHT
ncbi:hypothetical protein Hanom_Chr11g01054591 [Helianthus anomalus]